MFNSNLKKNAQFDVAKVQFGVFAECGPKYLIKEYKKIVSTPEEVEEESFTQKELRNINKYLSLSQFSKVLTLIDKVHYHIHMIYTGNKPIAHSDSFQRIFFNAGIPAIVRVANKLQFETTQRPHFKQSLYIQYYLTNLDKGHVDLFPVYSDEYRLLSDVISKQNKQMKKYLKMSATKLELRQWLQTFQSIEDLSNLTVVRRVVQEQVEDFYSINPEDQRKQFWTKLPIIKLSNFLNKVKDQDWYDIYLLPLIIESV